MRVPFASTRPVKYEYTTETESVQYESRSAVPVRDLYLISPTPGHHEYITCAVPVQKRYSTGADPCSAGPLNYRLLWILQVQHKQSTSAGVVHSQ